MADLYVTVAQCLKHIRRYGTVDIDNKTLERIFLYAMRGINCKEDHLDIAQRSSLYHYLKDKNIDEPYIKQFLKETEEKYVSITMAES